MMENINKDAALPFYICGVGTQESQCSIRRSNGSLLNQVIFSLKGEGVLETENGVYNIAEGEVLFLKAGEPHSYKSHGGKWSTGWVIFNGKNIDASLNALKFSGTHIFHLDHDKVIMNQFKEILSVYESSHLMKEYLASCKLYELLILLYQYGIMYRNGKTSGGYDVVEPIQLFIQQHFYEDISLEQLAAIVEVTPQYLCKAFKEHLHIGIIEFLTKIRLQEAKKMLMQTNLPVKEIASNVGYHDSSYFGKLFKKYEKMTPQQFRGV